MWYNNSHVVILCKGNFIFAIIRILLFSFVWFVWYQSLSANSHYALHLVIRTKYLMHLLYEPYHASERISFRKLYIRNTVVTDDIGTFRIWFISVLINEYGCNIAQVPVYLWIFQIYQSRDGREHCPKIFAIQFLKKETKIKNCP